LTESVVEDAALAWLELPPKPISGELQVTYAEKFVQSAA
jgi:hypothetical protein